MFVRTKTSKGNEYLQVVQSYWEDGRSKQRVIATLGRLDELEEKGQIDGILRSLGRLSQKVRVVEKSGEGRLEGGKFLRLGPGLVFGRLWKETGVQDVIGRLLRDRRFEFDVERTVFMSTLHRLFESGSDRQGDRWKEDYRIDGTEGLSLHHWYRAMRWLGEERTRIEEGLFDWGRDLFTKAEMYFFDTTSIYFEGAGGESLGQRGHSKDHRPDLPQMIVGAVLGPGGRPVCSPMWPGNKADVTTLVPVVKDLRDRLGIQRVTIVADRGMISADTIKTLQGMDPPVGYILGTRMRLVNEVKKDVLSRGGRYSEVRENLRVKEVMVDTRRYVVCHNPEEAERDRIVREHIIESLREELARGTTQMVKNKGYRRYLTIEKGSIEIDLKKVEEDARYDGKFVLQTNLGLPTADIALRYKDLWKVESLFRDVKSLIDTRPIHHHWDSTIQGHVFVSFLALLLLHELDVRQERRKVKHEWADIKRDLEGLEEAEVFDGGQRFWVRSVIRPAATAAFRAAGVAIPPTVREG